MERIEDIPVGETRELGSYEVTEEEILAFARKYDPQPFHTDPEAAEESMFGGLVASGWHTAAMTMRLLVDGLLAESDAMGSPGVDSLRFLEPVRPGDVLSARVEPTGTERWDGERGLAHLEVHSHAGGNRVLEMDALVLVPR